MTTTTDAPLTKADYEEALTNYADTAKRCPNIVGKTGLPPTKWDLAHKRINEALVDWEMLGS